MVRARSIRLREKAVELEITEGNGLDQAKKSGEIPSVDVVSLRKRRLQQERNLCAAVLPGYMHQAAIADELAALKIGEKNIPGLRKWHVGPNAGVVISGLFIRRNGRGLPQNIHLGIAAEANGFNIFRLYRS